MKPSPEAAQPSQAAASGSDSLKVSDLKATVTQEQLANLMIDQEARFKTMVQETLVAMMPYPPQQPMGAPLGEPYMNGHDASMGES